MLRISRIREDDACVTLKLEGRIVMKWAELLDHECARLLRERQAVVLDVADVRFADREGVRVLKRLAARGVEIINSSWIFEFLMEGLEL